MEIRNQLFIRYLFTKWGWNTVIAKYPETALEEFEGFRSTYLQQIFQYYSRNQLIFHIALLNNSVTLFFILCLWNQEQFTEKIVTGKEQLVSGFTEYTCAARLQGNHFLQLKLQLTLLDQRHSDCNRQTCPRASYCLCPHAWKTTSCDETTEW